MSATSVLACQESAIEHCREVTRREARNFYYGLRLLPEPQRSALYCIYSWMRQVDDLADDEAGRAEPAGAVRQLDDFRANTRQAIDGSLETDDPMWIAFQATVGHFELEAKPFDEMIDGQIADLDFKQPETMDDLVGYCRQVASTVGRICVSIWGHDDPRALELADQRGIAFQLTNVLRDIREDHDNGRIYLPSSVMDEAGMDIVDLLEWSDPVKSESLIKKIILHGEEHYRSSAALEGMITRSCRPTLRAMTRIYHGLLRRMDRNPRSVVGHRRVRLGSLRKISIALTARVQAGVS